MHIYLIPIIAIATLAHYDLLLGVPVGFILYSSFEYLLMNRKIRKKVNLYMKIRAFSADQAKAIWTGTYVYPDDVDQTQPQNKYQQYSEYLEYTGSIIALIGAVVGLWWLVPAMLIDLRNMKKTDIYLPITLILAALIAVIAYQFEYYQSLVLLGVGLFGRKENTYAK